MQANSKALNIPNILSLGRIILIPVFVALFYLPIPGHDWVCALVVSAAFITDWLDGYLARKLNQMSNFGAFIDPVADKLIVVIALILLVEQQSTVLFTIPALVIIGREIVVSALREWMSELGKRANVAVVTAAKYKTVLQMVAILLFLLAGPKIANNFQEGSLILGYVLLYIAAILTLWSMVIYLKLAWKDLWQ